MQRVSDAQAVEDPADLADKLAPRDMDEFFQTSWLAFQKAPALRSITRP